MFPATLISVLSLITLSSIASADFGSPHDHVHSAKSTHKRHSEQSIPLSGPSSHRHNRKRSPYNQENPHRHLLSRSITQDVTTASGASYDFIIAGGGLAGLAVASRLSEWSNVTVLVIEAGPSGDQHQDQINIPGYSYLHSLGGTIYDWNYTTIPQADNLERTMSWPRGRGLGGSGAVNGLYWCWAAKEDYDAWAADYLSDLNPGAEQTWNWDEMFKYMKKAETFTPPPASIQQEMGMVLEDSYHGETGPVQIGFSQFMYDGVKTWIPTWEALGLPSLDLFGGDTRGAAITPSTLNAKNQTRSDSRAAYVDPLPPRDNLVILTGMQVTEIIFSSQYDANGNKVASGVKFSAGRGQQEYSVQANKEVILSGGTVGSPTLLQLSGIGPKDKLAAAGVQSVVDIPVGYNLQDHLSFSMYWSTPKGTETWSDLQNNQTLQAQELAQYRDSATGLWTFINEAIAYPSMSDFMDAESLSAYSQNIQAALAQTAADVTSWQILPAGVSASLSKQYAIQQKWITTGVGQVEFLLTMLGQNGAQDQIGIQMALQHPWSRGSIFINSSDPFTPPMINPDYLGVGYDIDIMGYAAEYARKLTSTAPMSALAINETYPGARFTGDALANATRQSCVTEYHPLGTCSMLPKDEGGVVDTNLVVYGTANIRVIDSSIMPLQISAHLMASTYGIAEKGADIIKQKHFATEETKTQDPSQTAKPGVATDKTVTDPGKDKSQSGFESLSLMSKIGIGVGAGVGAILLVGAAVIFFCMRSKKKQREAASAAYGWQGFGSGTKGGGRYEGLSNNKEFDGYSGDSTPLHDFSRSQAYLGSPSPGPDFTHSSGDAGITHPLEASRVGGGMAGMGAGHQMGGYDDFSTGQTRPLAPAPIAAWGNGMGGSPGYGVSALERYATGGSGSIRAVGGGGGGGSGDWDTPSWSQSPPRQVYKPVTPR